MKSDKFPERSTFPALVASGSSCDPERWRGHLSLRDFGLEAQRMLGASRVAVAGCGGLGSPVALYLAAAGIGSLVLIDDDTVSLSNLQRQIIHFTSDIARSKVASAAAKLSALNPEVEISTYQCRLDSDNAPALLEGCNALADCTDSFASRLAISDICVAASLPCAVATVARYVGQVMAWKPGHKSYRDVFGDIVCDLSGEPVASSFEGILNTVPGIAGTIQATEIIKLLTNIGEPLIDRLLTFDVLTPRFDIFTL